MEKRLAIFPARESLVSDIPAWDGKIANLFLQCTIENLPCMPSTRLTGTVSSLTIRFFKQEALTATWCNNITSYLNFVYTYVQSYANIGFIQKRMFKFWGAKLNVGLYSKVYLH